MAESAAPAVSARRVVLVNSALQASARTQLESLCRAQGVKCRLSAEVGRRQTVFVLELRGAPEGLGTAMSHIDVYLQAQAAVPPPARWSRVTVGAVSFFAGLAGVLVFFYLISR